MPPLPVLVVVIVCMLVQKIQILLIDAGLSGKKVEEGLSSLGLTGNDI